MYVDDHFWTILFIGVAIGIGAGSYLAALWIYGAIRFSTERETKRLEKDLDGLRRSVIESRESAERNLETGQLPDGYLAGVATITMLVEAAIDRILNDAGTVKH